MVVGDTRITTLRVMDSTGSMPMLPITNR